MGLFITKDLAVYIIDQLLYRLQRFPPSAKVHAFLHHLAIVLTGTNFAKHIRLSRRNPVGDGNAASNDGLHALPRKRNGLLCSCRNVAFPIVRLTYPEVASRSLEDVSLLFTSESIFVNKNMHEYYRRIDEAGGNVAVAVRRLLDEVDGNGTGVSDGSAEKAPCSERRHMGKDVMTGWLERL